MTTVSITISCGVVAQEDMLAVFTRIFSAVAFASPALPALPAPPARTAPPTTWVPRDLRVGADGVPRMCYVPSDAVARAAAARARAKAAKHEGAACTYCGEWCEAAALTRDHIMPRCMGYDLHRNMALVCKPCNVAKGGHTLGEWLRYLRYVAPDAPPLVLAPRFVAANAHLLLPEIVDDVLHDVQRSA